MRALREPALSVGVEIRNGRKLNALPTEACRWNCRGSACGAADGEVPLVSFQWAAAITMQWSRKTLPSMQTTRRKPWNASRTPFTTPSTGSGT